MNLQELQNQLKEATNRTYYAANTPITVIDESEASDNRLFPVVEVRFVNGHIAFVVNEDISPAL